MVAPDVRASRTPAGVWLLVAIAAIYLPVAVLLPILAGAYWSLTLTGVIGVATTAAILLLAATVFVGTARWPAGRSWLIAGGVLLVVHALMEAFLDAWVVWSQVTPPETFGDLERSLLVVRGFAGAASGAAAPVLLAIGLWASRQGVPRASPGRIALMVAVGLLGAAALVSAVSAVVIVLLPRATPAEAALQLLIASRTASTAVLAMVAIRLVRRIGRLPELVIAVGGSLHVVASVGVQAYLALPPPSGAAAEWYVAAVVMADALVLVSLLVLAAGFALGRLLPARPARAIGAQLDRDALP